MVDVGGKPETAREAVSLPVLRKDFTIAPEHVIEAAAHGADAILLIAAILTERELREYREQAARYGMAALVEGFTIIGIGFQPLGIAGDELVSQGGVLREMDLPLLESSLQRSVVHVERQRGQLRCANG